MSTENAATLRTAPRREPEIGTAAAARDLIASLSCEPWGQVSPSTYETARLVSLAPWLAGQSDRVGFLLAEQRPDGCWGGPEGYALIPTLSATEALLTTIRRLQHPGSSGSDPRGGTIDIGGRNRLGELLSAADRGLRALFGWLRGAGPALPDTPAADLIVPALVSRLNEHLAQLCDSPLPGLAQWSDGLRLPLPVGVDDSRLDIIRQRITGGGAVPQKLLHALEVVGELAHGLIGVRPVSPGTVGASPAATAAWLGTGGTADGGGADAELAREYLGRVSRRHGGPVPCTTPITVFERAWVLSSLGRSGVPFTVPPALVRSLRTALGPTGAMTGPGLPTDADTTSAVLYALGQFGAPADPDCLWLYQTEAGFCTWPGEDGFSVTTNAHVLEALGHHLRHQPDLPTHYQSAERRLSIGLTEHQQSEGWWLDRWHASPYYATVCCVLALAPVVDQPATVKAITKAADWVIASQRSDGSWGRWAGTTEETAYALQVLLTADARRPGMRAAAARGYDYLLANPGGQLDPPLWHDKDLYRPAAIVRAATISTLQLGKRRPDLIELPHKSIRL